MNAAEGITTFVSESSKDVLHRFPVDFLSRSREELLRIRKNKKSKTSIKAIKEFLVKSSAPVLLDPVTLGLLEVADIKKISKRGPILILCSDPEVLLFAIIKAKLNPSKILSVKDDDSIQRMAHASKIGATDELIASASAENDLLVVTNCANRKISLKFDDTPFLKKIPEKDRANFEIDKYGSTISWLDKEIEMSFDSLLYHVDERHKAKVDKENLIRHKGYGDAIRKLRKESGLTQDDISGLSERHVRRIEQGLQPPTSKSLELLATAHDLSLAKYLAEVAKRV